VVEISADDGCAVIRHQAGGAIAIAATTVADSSALPKVW
jgi:hypothetical protein